MKNEKAIVLNLNAEEIDIIISALSELPVKISYNITNKILRLVEMANKLEDMQKEENAKASV